MSPRAARYAVISLFLLACGPTEDAPAADTGLMATDTVAGMVQGGMPRDTSARQDSAARGRQGNPSLDPVDTVPVRRAPPSSQSIVDTASLATIQKIVATHPQHVDSALTAMTGELKRLNRQPSAEWTALHDSVKADLDKLASVGDGELVTFFRAHYARFSRCMQMHRTAMAGPPGA